MKDPVTSIGQYLVKRLATAANRISQTVQPLLNPFNFLSTPNWATHWQTKAQYRRQIEQESSHSRDLREALFNESTDALFLVDPDTLLTVDCNDRAVVLFEANGKDELINLEGHTLQRRRFTDEELEQIANQINTQGFWSREVEYITRRGNFFWGNIAAKQINVAGRRLNLVRVTDISDRKRAEAALQESEARYRRIIETANEGIWSIDNDNKTSFVNPKMAEILGYTVDEMLGKSMFDFMDEAGIEIAHRNVERRRQGISEQHDFKFQHKNGSDIWALLSVSPIVDEAGHYAGALGMITDISDRKQAELSLQQANAELDRFFSVALDLLCIANTDGYFLRLNPAWERTLGYPINKLQGQKFLDFVHPDDRDATLDAVGVLSKGGEILGFTNRYRHQDESYRWIEWRSISVGNSIIYAAARDITEQRYAEAALRQSEAKNRAMLSAIPDLLLRVKRDGTCLDFIPPVTALEPNFIPIQCNIAEVLPPEILQYQLERMDQALATGELQVWEQQLLRFGVLCDEEVRLVHCEDDEFLIIVRDITERKQAEIALQKLNIELEQRVQQRTQDLQAERLRLQLALDAAQMGTWSCSLQTGVVIWSERAEEIFGFAPGTFPGTREAFLHQLHPEDFEQVTAAIAHTYETRSPYNIEYRIRQLDGDIRWIAAWGIIPADSPENDPQLIGVIADITARKQAEAALQQLNQELEQRVRDRTQDLQQAMEAAETANRAKSTFLANMSHELRTPLNTILGFAQLMTRDTTIAPEKRQQLNIINRSGEHLLNLINDILEMSKIEAGRIQFTPRCFNLYALLQTLEQMFSVRATEKGLSFTVQHPTTVPPCIETDENKLRQVLINLVGNAIKFTEQGQVILQVSTIPQSGASISPNSLPDTPDKTRTTLRFEITDSGSGIDPTELNSVFEPFTQSSKQIFQEGTGLGLSISRQFVQLMGGDLTAISTPGVGSTFTVTLPVQQVDATNLAASLPRRILALAPNQPSYRILVVEDNETNRQLLVQLLQSIGFDVQIAVNGQDAIALWQRWHPQLIWMDMQMPVLNGYEATRQIRLLEQTEGESQEAEGDAGNQVSGFGDGALPTPYPLSPIPHHPSPISNSPASPSPARTIIIALTASAFEEDRIRVLGVGCDDFVRKPFQETELLEKITEYLGVQYFYAESKAVEFGGNALLADPLDAIAALRALPSNWLNELYQATIQLDSQQLTYLIAQIAPIHPTLATQLTEKVDNFDFEPLLTLLQEAMPDPN
ncbi:MAG: PAS domain S-box protein [Oscillatoriales cyanobacterium C42_A2020_001]|nr:PAS domain S-box protein [Leptolyngbyaceae cyanobacterium C42_A2020_001]